MSTAVVVHEAPSAGLAVAPAGRVALLRPIAAPAEVVQAQEATRDMVAAALKEGRDYGQIPGTDKKALLKSGAERVALGFGCYYGEPIILEREVDHDRAVRWVKRKKVWRNQFKGDREFTWAESTGESLGLYRYVVKVPVVLRETGAVVGHGVGSCSTMESKYVENPRDAENTVLKMAHKRGVVGACLLTFGLSDQFTQDEDLVAVQRGAAADDAGADPPPADEPPAKCPKCDGQMFDNRATKRNVKAPDFKCRDRDCDGVYWPGQWPPAVQDAQVAAQQDVAGTPAGAGLTFPPEMPKRLADVAGTRVGECTVEQLRRVRDYAREKNAQRWVDAIEEELDARRVDDAPDASVPLPDPTQPGASAAVAEAVGAQRAAQQAERAPAPAAAPDSVYVLTQRLTAALGEGERSGALDAAFVHAMRRRLTNGELATAGALQQALAETTDHALPF